MYEFQKQEILKRPRVKYWRNILLGSGRAKAEKLREKFQRDRSRLTEESSEISRMMLGANQEEKKILYGMGVAVRLQIRQLNEDIEILGWFMSGQLGAY